MRRTMLLPLLILASLAFVACGRDYEDFGEVAADYVYDDEPALVVQVSLPGETFVETAGRVDVNRPGVPANDAQFRIGSVSKMFTAVVTLQLVEEGTLELDDTPAGWLPSATSNDVANTDSATLRDLLGMTSGIPDYLDDNFMDSVNANPGYVWQAGDMLKYAAGYDADFAPGTGFEYSNTNYILLQLVIEAATGTSLHTQIRQRILDPLGLDDTYTQIHEGRPDTFVHGYEDIDGDGQADDVTHINDGAGLGDGGLISTTGDMVTFLDALLVEQSLLEDSTLALMLDAGPDEYGLGIEVVDSAWGQQIGHSGGVLGFSSLAYYLPDYDAYVVVLSADFERDVEAIMQNALKAALP